MACHHEGVSAGATAAGWAEQQVALVRDDPGGRIALMQRCYYGPYGQAPRHLPFRRAAMSFMQWQLRRGCCTPRTVTARAVRGGGR